MRIAHVNTEFSWGGGEAQTIYLARELAAAGHDCRLFAYRSGKLYRSSKRAGLEVKAVPGGPFPNPALFLFLWNEIASGSYDICHFHTAHAVAMGAYATAGQGGCVRIATRRTSNSLGGNFLSWTGPWKILDHVIAVSETVRDRLLDGGVVDSRISVIHSAVDIARFSAPGRTIRFRREVGAGDADFLVGVISRLTARKGQDRLIEAAARLRNQHPNLRVVIIGEGEKGDDLARRIGSLGLEGVVSLLGFREDIPVVLAGLDCLVFPSALGEGSPGVIKEAMSAGVPVIGVDHPIVREIVTPGKSALLVSPEDVGSLAWGIDCLIRNPSLARSLALHGRDEAERYSVRRMVAATEAVYRKALLDRRMRKVV